jgi:hypothetical protein
VGALRDNRVQVIGLLLIAGLLAACADKPTFERGLTDATRKQIGRVRLLTVIVQDELGAQYHTRSTTARLLNTAQIHGVAFMTKGALYIGPAPDSMTPWLDTSDYVAEDIGDMPGVVSALDPGNALRVVTKIALAPVLRAQESSEHKSGGKTAYDRIASARAAMKKVRVKTMFQEDQTNALKSALGIKFETREVSNEWPLPILQKGVGPKERPLLLLFTQYTLTADLRQLHVQTEATVMRTGDTVEAPSYRNRFTYDSPRLPVPGKPTEAGKEPEPWEKELLTKMMLARWNKDGGAMLQSELHRASHIIAEDMAMDLAGRVAAAISAQHEKEKAAKEKADKEAEEAKEKDKDGDKDDEKKEPTKEKSSKEKSSTKEKSSAKAQETAKTSSP